MPLLVSTASDARPMSYRMLEWESCRPMAEPYRLNMLRILKDVRSSHPKLFSPSLLTDLATPCFKVLTLRLDGARETEDHGDCP